jgi:hypothetical protein
MMIERTHQCERVSYNVIRLQRIMARVWAQEKEAEKKGRGKMMVLP